MPGGQDRGTGHFDDLLKTEFKAVFDIESTGNVPRVNLAGLAEDDGGDIIVSHFTELIEVIFPDIKPIGYGRGGEIDQRTNLHGDVIF